MPKNQSMRTRDSTWRQTAAWDAPSSRRRPMASGMAAPHMKMKSGMIMSQKENPTHAGWLRW